MKCGTSCSREIGRGTQQHPDGQTAQQTSDSSKLQHIERCRRWPKLVMRFGQQTPKVPGQRIRMREVVLNWSWELVRFVTGSTCRHQRRQAKGEFPAMGACENEWQSGQRGLCNGSTIYMAVSIKLVCRAFKGISELY